MMGEELNIQTGILLILAYRFAPFVIGVVLGHIEFQWVDLHGSVSLGGWATGLVAVALMVWTAIRYPLNRPRPAAVAVAILLAWQVLFVAWSLKLNGIKIRGSEILVTYIAASIVILVCSYLVYFTSWGKANFNYWLSHPDIRRREKP